MSQHARPHLQTHNRSEGHSAVAGAAYRLGLRLYDKRAGKWHDYRLRKLGEEIVRAITVAPDDAPNWATDPNELWNRVEAAERRKDAQVARDYRIPIPFGLSDRQAGDLAEEMARFIANELTTSVSMGLHRDADVDVLGNLKPETKQGYHAHLYFPTRKIEQIEDSEGSRAWGLGAKLLVLSNKRTSSILVERFNAYWAMLANRIAAANDLVADYDHRSYLRQELAIVPQITVGQAATAMERKGIPTKRGDALRAGIVTPVDALKAAEAIVLDVRRQESEELEAMAPQRDRVDVSHVIHAAVPLTQMSTPILIDSKLLARSTDSQSLTDRLHAWFARSANGAPSMRVVQMVSAIERALNALLFLAVHLARRGRQRDRSVLERQDILSRLQRARAIRSEAREKAREWEAHHPVWVASARLFRRSASAKPAAWRALLEEAVACDKHVQALKETMSSHQADLVAFDVKDSEIKDQQGKEHQVLEMSLEALAVESPEAVKTLLEVATEEEAALLKSALPQPDVLPAMPMAPPEHALTMARPRTSLRM